MLNNVQKTYYLLNEYGQCTIFGMTTPNKGFVRGILYPLIALILHVFLMWITGSGLLSATGALLVTALVGKVDHTMLPDIYPDSTL